MYHPGGSILLNSTVVNLNNRSRREVSSDIGDLISLRATGLDCSLMHIVKQESVLHVSDRIKPVPSSVVIDPYVIQKRPTVTSIPSPSLQRERMFHNTCFALDDIVTPELS